MAWFKIAVYQYCPGTATPVPAFVHGPFEQEKASALFEQLKEQHRAIETVIWAAGEFKTAIASDQTVIDMYRAG